MDEAIRSLLLEATVGDNGKENLMNAYMKLKRSQESSDQLNAFGAEIYVICAEAALKNNQIEMTEDCLKMFFQKAAPGNDFLGRAYMCQAQLNKPTSSKFPDQLEKCASFILKAINFGKLNKRHHYLVYNGSVLYCSFARPFLKHNCQHFLAKTLHQIVKALDDIDDKDYEWRSQLMISLIECYLDGGKKEEAAHVSTAAASFVKSYCPQMYKLILALQVQHKLIDQSKLLKESKLSNDVVLYFKILKLKSQIENGEKVDVDIELDKLHRAICNDGIETPGTGRSTRIGQNTIGPITQTDRVPLMLDLARLCLECERVQLAEDCLASSMGIIQDSSLKLEIEFLKSEIVAQRLKEKKSQYTKTAIERRAIEIESLEENLCSAIRLKVPPLIQSGCVAMWNLCLPLLQKDLRKIVKGPLKIVSETLEDIDSLLITMRCQIHVELAKCEEENEQLEYAMNHLKKALMLDDTGAYEARIEGSLHRLELRSMLYQVPERAEDIAALIIEQARSTKEAGNLQMKRASLVKAGLTLAPDAFGLVMDGETGLTTPRSSPTDPHQLAEKIARYRKSTSKISGHLKRLDDDSDNDNDKERVQIWADLVKTARKQNVWDVTRVAAKFCLLYDDGRWEAVVRESSAKDEQRPAVQNGNVPHEGATGKRSASNAEKFSEDNQDLMRIIAEVHFIYAEALVQLLLTEGVKLLENPVPVEDASSKPKSREGKDVKVEDTREWKEYSDWIESLSNDAVNGFHRGAKVGADMNSPWLICNAGVYLWNYVNHVLMASDFSRLRKIFQPVYDNMRNLGYAEDISFYCELAHALAQGYMQPHLPNSRQTSPAVVTEKDRRVRGSKQSASPVHSKSKTFVITNDAEALNELKQALEILEHALNLTSGADTRCLVPIATRHQLIKTWVFCKMLTGQPLPKNLGHDDETVQSQGPMSKALCAVEALSLQHKYACDMTNCPGLFEVIKLVESCKWTDRLVEIETWTRLASLASKSSFCQVVLQCGEKALEIAKSQKPVKYGKLSEFMKHKYKVEQELLYYSSVLMGENLVAIMHGRNETRHTALSYFSEACRFATKAQNYKLAMCAAKHYWNTCQPFILTPIERKLLKEPIRALLLCIADAWKYSDFKAFQDKNGDSGDVKVSKPSVLKGSSGSKKKDKGKGKKGPSKGLASGAKVQIGGEESFGGLELSDEISKVDSDLSLRAALYGVLFQAYADTSDWKNGLKAMDEAVKTMPRTHHRLLIFKHRVIVNARLGNPVQFDMGKFKDTDDVLLSSMWNRVAKNSREPRDQLTAYQNSIECLQSIGSEWQKVDYLSEFADWLFVNEFPLQDCLDQLETAMCIVIEGIKSKYLRVSSSAKTSNKPIDATNNGDIKNIINDCIDIRSLETLARLHVMSAQMQANFSQNSRDHALTAAFCIQKIWQNSIRIGERAIRDGLKPGEPPFSKTDLRRKDGNKIDRATSKSCLPQTLEQWALFTLPEKLKEHFKNDALGYFISEKSIVKSELTVHYLENLNEMLCMYGYHTLCLPICNLLCYIASEILADKFMTILAKLQLHEILNALQMVSACSSLSKSLSCQYFTEEDKAESREDILIWNEKQAQVKSEQEKQITDIRVENQSSKDTSRIEFVRNKRCISGIDKRQIWTKIAELLIRQGQYNDARELLEEARKSAEGFKDDYCLAHIEYNCAVLAYNECDWGTAVSHLDRIQNLEGTLDFWCKVVILKVDAYYRFLALATTFQSHPEVTSSNKAIEILSSSIHLLESLAKKSPNRFSQSFHIKAILKAELAEYLLKTRDVSCDKERSEIFQLLEECLQVFNALGHGREALKIVKLQSYLWQTVIPSVFGEERKTALIKCLEVSKKAIEIAKETQRRVKRASNEHSNACLPIDEELAETVLQTMRIFLDILQEITADIHTKAATLFRRDSMLKMLEDYVSVTPMYTENQREWNSTARLIGEEALSFLNYIYACCDSFPKCQAKASMYIGKCLHQIALQRFPDLKEYEQKDIIETSSHGSLEGGVASDGLIDENLRDKIEQKESITQNAKDARKRQRAEQIKHNYAEYSLLIVQAVEYLTQAVQIGLRNGFKDIISQSAFSLVQCIGSRDVSASVHFLALYQSAAGAMSLGETAQRVFLDPKLSRVAGLTQQRKNLNDVALNCNDSLGARGLNLEFLQTESETWRRLHIARNHIEIIKEIPFPVTFVILQHSPDKTKLYAALLEKPKTGIQTGKKRDASTGVVNRSRICCKEVSKRLLDDLIRMAEQFKSDVSSFLLHKNYFLQQMKKRKEMLGLIDRSSKMISKENLSFETDLSNEEKRLQSCFDEIVRAMEAYFGKMLGQLKDAFVQEPAVDTVVILADRELLQLPLEALPLFRQAEIKSVTRDFTLQIFYHRITQGELAEQQNGKNDKNKVAKKDKVELKAKTDKATGNNKKGKITKELMFGKDGVFLDMSNLRYIVDPSCEWPPEDKDCPSNVISELITKLKNKATKWVGLNGHERIPSITEMQKFIQESSSLIFYGFEHFFAHIPPQLVAPLSLSDCHLIALLDNMRTLKSSLNQGKLDAQKSPADLALEHPLETGLLLSLCGAPCVILNQWQCEVQNNNERLQLLIEGICENSVTVGQALQAHRCPRNGNMTQLLADADSSSEKANSSQGRQKFDRKNSKLQHRNSRPESLRSNKVSSVSSIGRPKKEDDKQKTDYMPKERTNSRSEESKNGETTGSQFSFERYNTVLYGVPNFSTTLQIGTS